MLEAKYTSWEKKEKENEISPHSKNHENCSREPIYQLVHMANVATAQNA